MDLVSQNLLLTSGGGKKSTYVDDVFSTYLYNGDGTTSNAIDIGVDLTEGGLVWLKSRSDTMEHYLFDTVRGATKYLDSATTANEATSGQSLKSFNNNGFTLGDNGAVNSPSRNMTSWTFRKAPGFFDVVTFTSTGAANQRIPHNLECEPGVIICKSLTGTSMWVVYHKEIANLNPSDPWTTSLALNEDAAATTYASDTWGTGPTSTDFGFKAGGFAGTGVEWIAYVFAGGESTAATARSVQFNQNYIKSGSTSDYTMGTGDFTVECWWKPTEISNQGICQISDGGNGLTTSNWENTIAIGHNGSNWVTYGGNGNADSADYAVTVGVWYHLAYVKTGGSHKLYVNGTPVITRTDSTNYYGTTVAIGGYYSTGYTCRGYVSNFRITKGQALYTAPFEPSIAPLTTTSQGATSSNVKLLCCNNASVTGSTVTGATISVGSGSPTARTNNPFIDQEAYKFGEDEDQNIIKCGHYRGNGSEANGPVVDIGWEPQWLLVKNIGSAQHWGLIDCMRQISEPAGSNVLFPNRNNAEDANANSAYITSATGFKLATTNNEWNGNGYNYVYMAIRRPDGLVGKPAKVGTEVFTTAASNAGSSPGFTSGFPVDFYLYRKPTASSGWQADWGTYARLIAKRKLWTNKTNTEGTDNSATFAFNDGVQDYNGFDSSYQAWMWKRHAGFDVVTWKGLGASSAPRTFSHSLGRAPEMIWTKGRNSTYDWRVWHKDLNSGGASAAPYNIVLNSTGAQSANGDIFGGSNNVLPTSMHFTTGGNASINQSGTTQIAYLFASVDGISKVGSYDGTGVSGLTVTTGFTPRFLIIKNITWTHGDWFVYDTTRGWASGTNGEVITLNSTGAQSNTGTHKTSPTSTGFSVDNTDTAVNVSGQKYIYYAHA